MTLQVVINLQGMIRNGDHSQLLKRNLSLYGVKHKNMMNGSQKKLKRRKQYSQHQPVRKMIKRKRKIRRLIKRREREVHQAVMTPQMLIRIRKISLLRIRKKLSIMS